MSDIEDGCMPVLIPGRLPAHHEGILTSTLGTFGHLWRPHVHIDGGHRLFNGGCMWTAQLTSWGWAREGAGSALHQLQIRLVGLVAKACGAVWLDAYASLQSSGAVLRHRF